MQTPFQGMVVTQRQKQSYRTLEQSLQERRLRNKYIIYQDALRLIPQMKQPSRAAPSPHQEERIRFEIILKTSKSIFVLPIVLCRIIITHQQFTMIKACRIEINLYSLYPSSHTT